MENEELKQLIEEDEEIEQALGGTVDKQETTSDNRNEKGQFVKGVSGNLKGRNPETEEEKAIKKARKELINDYTEKLAGALADISPVLIALAVTGDISAIKEINNRVLGMPKQSISLDTEELVGEVKFELVIKKNENSNTQNNSSIPEELGGVSEQKE